MAKPAGQNQHLAYYLNGQADSKSNSAEAHTEKQLPAIRHRHIRQADVTKFIRQLASMMKAGIPLVQGLGLLIESNSKPAFRALTEQIRDWVNTGKSLSSALRQHPTHFNPLLCSLIEIGEQAGILDSILERIACDREKAEKLGKHVRSALTYPAAVILVAIGISGILLTKVVPQFEVMFQSFQVELPIFTQKVINFSEWFRLYWLPALGSLTAIILIAGQLYRKNMSFAFLIDRLLLACPLLGALVQKTILAKCAYTLATTFNAGAPLAVTLEAISSSIGNQVYARALQSLSEKVSAGETMLAAMQSTNAFPSMMMQMVNIGEETGQIAEMLSKVAEYYELDVETTVGSLIKLLEPITMCVLGLLVGGLIVAMYLPIFNLGSVLNSGF